MSKPIHQSVRFPASAHDLYQLFIDPKKHAAFTGGKVRISPRPGSPFSAFDGMLSGSMLYVVPNQLIVQRWRGTHWTKDDLDSLLIIRFTDDTPTHARIDLTHVNVPAHDHAGVTNGWKKYYWTPLRAHLKSAAAKR